ncbi:putative lipase atg15 [Meristemomyces frigidus]|nr:putative lipase atg15 [Meristemomyces frigidus]
MWTAKVALVCLVIAAFSGHGDAARTPQQRREQRNPYLILPPGSPDSYDAGRPSQDLGERDFTLRHIYHHGSHQYPRLHRYQDIPNDAILRVTEDYGETFEDAPTDLRVRVASTNIQRLAKRKPADIDRLLQHADIHGEAAALPSTAWTVDEIAGPNITDKKTVLTFAKMAANAYVQEHNKGDWQDVKGGYNYTDDFGWQEDGLRGHIFADETNKTIVIGLKGTSPAVFDGADTTGNDKLNDNLFGSCCCGQGGNYLWKQVCDCMTTTYTCNSTCLVKSLREKGHYYWAVRDLYHNVTERYPHSDVWLAGHSLGGVVSGLLGLTYGLPTMTFEAFPDALAASRLGLPTPPGYRIGAHQSRVSTGIYHFGHTADPIYMGTCNGGTSFCTLAGYAFQGVCHTGHTCTYDTVGDLGWRVGIGTHKITNVIKDVIEKYDTQRADYHFQQLYVFYADEDGDLQDARLVGLLGREHDIWSDDQHFLQHKLKLDIDLQNARMVRLQGSHHDDFVIVHHRHDTFSCAGAYINDHVQPTDKYKYDCILRRTLFDCCEDDASAYGEPAKS